MAKAKKEKTITEKKYIRIFLAIFSMLFVIVSLWIIIDCFDNSRDNKELVASYKINDDVNYKVYYNANEFYDGNYIEMDNKYLSSLINRIEINFNYEYSVSRLTSTTYTYDVTTTQASDYVSNNEKSPLWSRSEAVVPPTTKEVSRSTTVDINEPVIIDYSKYNSQAFRYKNVFSISIDSYILVKFNIKFESKILDSDEIIIDNRSMEVKIPLLQSVIAIDRTVDDGVSKNIYVNNTIVEDFNYTLLIIAIIVIAFTLPVAIISIARLLVITGVSKYVALQKRYLRNYGDIIAEVSDRPNLKDIEVLDITNFEDLVNIEEELRIPIIFYEMVKEKETWYLIIDHDKAYRYVLRSSGKRSEKLAKRIEKFQE